jgi:hypothetical protein
MPYLKRFLAALLFATSISPALAASPFTLVFETEHHVDRTLSPVSDVWQLSVLPFDPFKGPADTIAIASSDGTLTAQLYADGSGYSPTKVFNAYTDLQTFIDATPWNLTATTGAGTSLYNLYPDVSSVSESQVITFFPTIPSPHQLITTTHPTFAFPAIDPTRNGFTSVNFTPSGDNLTYIQVTPDQTSWSPTIPSAGSYDFEMSVNTINQFPIGTANLLSGPDLGTPLMQYYIQSVTETPFTVTVPEPSMGLLAPASIILLVHRRRPTCAALNTKFQKNLSQLS